MPVTVVLWVVNARSRHRMVHSGTGAACFTHPVSNLTDWRPGQSGHTSERLNVASDIASGAIRHGTADTSVASAHRASTNDQSGVGRPPSVTISSILAT